MPHFPIANYTIIPSTHKYERINFYLRSIDRNMRTILCIVRRRRLRYHVHSDTELCIQCRDFAPSLSLSLCVFLCQIYCRLVEGNWKHTATRITADKIKLTSFSFCGIGSDGFWTGFSSSIKFAQRTFLVSKKSIRVCLFFARNGS